MEMWEIRGHINNQDGLHIFRNINLAITIKHRSRGKIVEGPKDLIGLVVTFQSRNCGVDNHLQIVGGKHIRLIEVYAAIKTKHKVP